MDLIKRYGRPGSFGPHGMFFSPRLSNESLIGLYGLYNKEVVKLQGGFYLALSKKIKPKVCDPVGGCPHEAFRGTAAGRVRPEKIPGFLRATESERSPHFSVTGGFFLLLLFLSTRRLQEVKGSPSHVLKPHRWMAAL